MEGTDMPQTRNSVGRRRFGYLAGALVVAASLMLSGCAVTANGGGSHGNLIGVAFASRNQVRWGFEEKIIKDTAAKNGDTAIVDYANESMATQANQVESMIQRGVKVLVLCAIDAAAAAPLVTKAQSFGIKVITYDRDVVGAKADYVVERNNYDMGKLQAQSALRAVPSGKYAIIRGDQATLAEVDMGRAYDELLLRKPGVNVVYDQLTPSWNTATAQKEAEAALQKDPDINAFVVMWDDAAQAIVQALKSAGKKPGQVFVTGADASPPSLSYIAQGWQGQTTWTPFDQMATDAANIAHALASGKGIPKPTTTVNGVSVDYVKLTSVEKGNLCTFVTKTAPNGWVSQGQVFGPGTDRCS